MAHQELTYLVQCYLDLHNNEISEPEFTQWLETVASPEDIKMFREMLLEQAQNISRTQDP